MEIEIYVCPDCLAWHPETVNGFPRSSTSCGFYGHRPAELRVFVPRAAHVVQGFHGDVPPEGLHFLK